MIRRIPVPWEKCPLCGHLDGFHPLDCPGESVCIRCGGDINWPHASELADDGICDRCTDAFFAECEAYRRAK